MSNITAAKAVGGTFVLNTYSITAGPAIIGGPTANSADIGITIDRAGTGYWLLLPAGSDAPDSAMLTSSGIRVGLAANTPATIVLTGLTADTAYRLYFVAKDDVSGLPGSIASVALRTQPMRCSLTASPTVMEPGGSSVLTATCEPAATAYVWRGSGCEDSTGAVCTVLPLTTASYGITGSQGLISGTAAVTVVVRNSFPGLRNNYAISKISTGFSVTDLVSSGRVTVPTGTAAIQFADVKVNLTIGDLANTVDADDLRSLMAFYVAFFNRVPDADGLAYWITRVRDGMTLEQVADSFYAVAVVYSDLTDYSATMNHAEFVRIIYANALGRTGIHAPPDADVQYWANLLDSRQSSRGQLLLTMLEAARTFAGHPTWGWVAQWLDNKVDVARFFAIEQGLNYNTPALSIVKGMAIAAKVSPVSTAEAMKLIDMRDTGFNLSLP